MNLTRNTDGGRGQESTLQGERIATQIFIGTNSGLETKMGLYLLLIVTISGKLKPSLKKSVLRDFSKCNIASYKF